MGLLFKNEAAAREIFTAWHSEMGRVDEKRTLRITFVRGIDKAHPHAYRVVITGNPASQSSTKKFMTVLGRVCRMDAATPDNLERFLRAYNKHHRFLLVPGSLENNLPRPEFELALGVYDLNVRNAWEIGLHDFDGIGILADDDVVVPNGIETPPVVELQRWKRDRENSEEA